MATNAFLLINGLPYLFPLGWVQEKYSLGTLVQYPSTPHGHMFMTPTDRSATLEIAIPLEKKSHQITYTIAKQAIRATTLLFSTQRTLSHDQQVTADQQLRLFDHLRFPFARPSAPAPTMRPPTHLPVKKRVPFSRVQIPWHIQIACAYFGKSVQMLCCAPVAFHTVLSAHKSLELWTIQLVEYAFRQTEHASADASLPHHHFTHDPQIAPSLLRQRLLTGVP